MLQNIIRLCKERNISLAELERQAGINQKSIYRWDENTPSVDKVKKVADFFGITMEELLTVDKQEPNNE